MSKKSDKIPDKKSERQTETRPSRDKQVTLADGFVITMSPIKPEKLPAVIDSLSIVADLHEKKLSPIKIFAAATEQVRELLKESIKATGEITLDLADIPIVMNVFLDQNLNEATLTAWRMLTGRLTEIMPAIKVPDVTLQ